MNGANKTKEKIVLIFCIEYSTNCFHFANKTILEKYGNGFTDRSRITIFAANMVNPHGMSFHNIIYEDGINESVLQDLSMLERLSYQEKDVNDVLDEFLNSFNVVSNRSFIIEGGT